MVDLAASPAPPVRRTVGGVEVVTTLWPPEEAAVTLSELPGGLWRGAWDDMASVQYAKLGVLRGTERDDGVALMKLSFSAAGDRTDGRAVSIKGAVEVGWEKSEDEWRVSEWRTRELKVSESPGAFFKKSLRAALPDDDDFAVARRSVHENPVGGRPSLRAAAPHLSKPPRE